MIRKNKKKQKYLKHKQEKKEKFENSKFEQNPNSIIEIALSATDKNASAAYKDPFGLFVNRVQTRKIDCGRITS